MQSQEGLNSPEGLLRTRIAGSGRTLLDAFDRVERASRVERVTRHPFRLLRGARLNVGAEEGEGYWDLTQIGDDVYVVVADFAFKDSLVEVVPGDGLIQFYLALSGSLTLGLSTSKPLRIDRPGLLVYHQPKGLDFDEWTTPNAVERSIAITVSRRFLIEHLCGSPGEVPPALDAFLQDAGAELRYCRFPLNARLHELGNKLLNNRFSGPLKLIYTEAIALEILCEAVRTFAALADPNGARYSDRELRCLHAAHKLLARQMTPAPTTQHIARKIGISATALKRGFKEVFGESLFEFSTRCRMQHALGLLRDRATPIAHVAAAVGYGHPTSFATAFRRHFGFRPRDACDAANTSAPLA